MPRATAIATISSSSAGVEVGRNLDQERAARLGLVTSGDDPLHELVQGLAPLEIPQPGRVGRRDVDGQIVGNLGESSHAERIILDPVGGVLVRPDIDADDARWPPPETGERPRKALVVEAEAVNDRAVLVKAKKARACVSFLGQGGQRAHFHEAESQREHGAWDFGVLVEAGGEAERIGELKPKGFDCNSRIARSGRSARRDLQRVDRRAMGRLRWQMLQNRSRHITELHASRLPNI